MPTLFFASDYMEGAHPRLLQRLVDTNFEKTSGYGGDGYCESAKEKIRAACDCPDAAIYFLVGGTQTNAVLIDAFLRSYQGVLSADTGHIALHEAGAIEASGHKVLPLPPTDGKISAAQVEKALLDYQADANHEHMVMPGMVYISHPTEYGTLYSKEELTALSQVCRAHQIPLYLDGARLAYALACPESDVTLKDLAALTDAFYIGGTKCGALFGEAVVIPSPAALPHLFTIIKQHGALLAKGRLLGIQYDELFTDGLYETLGKPAIEGANRIRECLRELGLPLYSENPTNQVFTILEDEKLAALGDVVEYSFWEKIDEGYTAIRLATSWATQEEDINALLSTLKTILG
ncbi:MAG: aminotransferase class I/II-fold pyridoxal phosphate-dependent enzyme [Blautia sp.]|nr:aminotransferase class I/II-fold pyridoxal phosphate-dependent enzyme [Blautia sp.]